MDSVAPLRVQLDECIKEVLADVQILARILKYTVSEVKDLNIDEIIACIDEKDIAIGRIPVASGYNQLGKISGSNTEDSVLGEGRIFYDIKFPVYCKKEQFKVIINIEAQRSTNVSKLGYHLENRIIYYLARMISSQKNVEFFKSDYDSIKKVYSIWICMDADSGEDAIEEFVFSKHHVFGKETGMFDLDKMRAVIIRIRKNSNIGISKNKLIAMLEILLSKEHAVQKKALLSNEFGMIMSVDLDRRIGTMCNLSEVIMEQAIEEGLEQGLEQGLRKVVCNMLKMNRPIEEICLMTERDASYVNMIKQTMNID